MPTIKQKIDQRIIDEAQSHATMTKNLVVRISPEMHAKLALIAKNMTEEIPGRRTTISDVARGIIEYGLKERPAHYPVSWPHLRPPPEQKE